MPMTGLHVAFSSAGGPGDERSPSALLDGIVSSQTITTGSATLIAAPATSLNNGKPVAHLIASVDGYVSIGRNVANANADPRFYIRASDPPLDVFVETGDKIGFTAA